MAEPATIDAADSVYDARWDRGGFSFTPDDFTRIRDIIYRTAGIALSPGKKDLVYSRLARRLRARRLDSFGDYLKLLEEGDREEREAFVNSLTTNTTSFFREPHHFEILADHLARTGKNDEISIWSCASSTGEEPYSIAMTLADLVKGANTRVRILATDIDTNVLEKAKRGVYSLEQVEKLTPNQLKRFFLRGEGKHSGMVRVKPEIREMVTFLRLNLLDAKWPLRTRFHAVFCRNVMIYFDKKTQQEVIRKLIPHLQPDGLFFAGHSESLHHAGDLFRMCGKTVYALKN